MNQTANDPIPAPKTEAVTPPKRPRPAKRRGRPLKWIVIVVLLAAGVCAGLRYWAHPQSAAVEYKTSPVTRGDVVQIVTANGALTPVQLVEVGSQISGVITEIKADFNSRVKAGDIVAQIDSATYERAKGQAE